MGFLMLDMPLNKNFNFRCKIKQSHKDLVCIKEIFLCLVWKHKCNCTCSISLAYSTCTTVNGTCWAERLILNQLSCITTAPQWLDLPEVMMLSSGLCDTVGQKVLEQQASSWGCCLRLWANSRRHSVHVCKHVFAVIGLLTLGSSMMLKCYVLKQAQWETKLVLLTGRLFLKCQLWKILSWTLS